jgi:hypothetical protein
MEIDYEWSIVDMVRKVNSGFVERVHWRCDATERDLSEKETIRYSYKSSSVAFFDGELITPYEDLTKEQVLGWVWEKVNKEKTEASLVAQIEAQKNLVSATGVPWVNTGE